MGELSLARMGGGKSAFGSFTGDTETPTQVAVGFKASIIFIAYDGNGGTDFGASTSTCIALWGDIGVQQSNGYGIGTKTDSGFSFKAYSNGAGRKFNWLAI